MDYKEMNECLGRLNQVMWDRESLYIENEGECTEETEALEAEVSDLQALLQGDGLNLLGEWLKAKEDRKAALKAEKDYVARQIAATEQTIEFIKGKIAQVMDGLEITKTEKGSRGYSFTRTISNTTSVDKEVLNERYKEKVDYAMREVLHIPAYIGFSLTASSSAAQIEGIQQGDEDLFITTSKDSVRFTKPRAKKEAE